MIDGPMLPRLVTRGPSTIEFRGRQIDRLAKFVDPEEITCPDGHHIKSSVVIVGELGLRCEHKATPSGPYCGALLWVVMLPAPRHESLFFYADVEYRELLAWQNARYSIQDIFRYLGVWCTRGDARRAARAQRRGMR